MALRTITRAVEIPLARVLVPRLKIGDVDETVAAAAAQRLELRLLIVDESDDRVHLGRTEIEAWHAFLDAARAHHGSDLVSPHVFGDQDRAGEVGSQVTAGSIVSVAKATLGCEEIGRAHV